MASSSVTPEKPKKQGRIAQIRQVYSMTQKADPKLTLWVVGTFLAVFLVFLGLGFLLKMPVLLGILGFMFALMAAMLVLSRRAERAAYAQIEGQPGAAGAALGSLRRGWYVNQEPVAADAQRPGDAHSAAVVYRILGRCGVVLVAEGPRGRAKNLLVKERKKVERVAPGVPVHTMQVGDGEGEVPLTKLAMRIQKIKPEKGASYLTKEEMSVVNKRLQAIGGIKPPIPKGVDPTRARMDRRALRGR